MLNNHDIYELAQTMSNTLGSRLRTEICFERTCKEDRHGKTEGQDIVVIRIPVFGACVTFEAELNCGLHTAFNKKLTWHVLFEAMPSNEPMTEDERRFWASTSWMHGECNKTIPEMVNAGRTQVCSRLAMVGFSGFWSEYPV